MFWRYAFKKWTCTSIRICTGRSCHKYTQDLSTIIVACSKEMPRKEPMLATTLSLGRGADS